MNRSQILIIVALAALLPAGALHSQPNLLTNGGFGSNLAGWSLDNSKPSEYLAEWNGLDAAGAPGSGSVLLVNSHPSGGTQTTPIVQCVPVVGGETYELDVQALIPGGQSRTGYFVSFVYWYPVADCLSSAISLAGYSEIHTVGAWTANSTEIIAPPGAQGARVDLALLKVEGLGTLVAHADNLSLRPSDATTCVPSGETLCLDDLPGDRRFRVRSSYMTVQAGGLSGNGQAIQLDPVGVNRGGVFWFFDSTNPELLIKVLNGCANNDHFWVFYSAGTNVGFTVAVVDTHTGLTFTRGNPDLTPALPLQSLAALPCS